jgi:TP901 family phage tail tape measure protein
VTVVGEAFVVIRPDDDKFVAELGAINLSKAGQKMSAQLSQSLEVVGADLRKQIEDELADLPSEIDVGLHVDADTAEANSAIRKLEAETVDPITVAIDADADPLIEDIRRLEREAEEARLKLERIAEVGDKFVSAGQKLTVGLSLPLVLLGKRAIGLASDVQTTLAQTIGLAGGTAEQVKQANEVIRSLAGETGKGLDDLSEALLAVFSAGFTGKAAFDILDVSAHAAAAGLGGTRDVANAVTNALSAYGPGVLSAADATDILVNAVKEGKAEASELAPQFGRLLPVASELGIRFSDVGAGLAFLTRSSGDASLSASQLAGVFNKLLKPSQQGAEALLDAGFSAERIRKELQDKGLLGTLVDIRGAVEDTGGTFSDVFDDVEALNGALALTRAEGANAAPVFDHLAESQGQLDAAFASFDETDSAKLAKASANFNVALTDFGNVALPVLAEVLGLFSTAAEAFDHLPKPLQEGATAALALAAALGPVLIIGGKVAQNFAALLPLFTKVGKGLDAAFSGSALTKAAKIGGGLAIIAGGLEVINSRISADTGDTEAFLGGLVDQINQAASSGDFDALSAKLVALGDARNELADDFNQALDPFKKRQLTDAITGIESIQNAAGHLRIRASDLAAQLHITTDEALKLAAGGDAAVEAFGQARLEIGIDVDPLVAANVALEDLTLAFLRGKETQEQFAAVSLLTNIPVADLKENLGKLADQARDLGDSFVQGLGGISQAFEVTFGDEAKDTVNSFLNNYAKQVTDAASFTLNLEKLISRGATGLAQTFATQGVGAAGLAAEAAGASDAALADMETRFDFIALQEDTAVKRERDFAVRITDGTLGLVEDANKAAEGLFGPDVAETIGPRLAAALAQGDEAFFAELDNIAAEARSRSVAIGEGVGAGTAEGLAQSIAAIQAAAQAVVDATIGIFTGPKGFDTGSPSKVMMRIGGFVAEGFNEGITSNLVAPDFSQFTSVLPSGSQAAAQALALQQPFGASPANLGASPAGGVTFTGDIIVPVPAGATPREQAEQVGRQVTFLVQGAVG